MKSLLSGAAFSAEVGYVAAGQTAQSTGVLDMAGYDGAVCIAHLGTCLANGVLKLEVFGGTTSAAATTEYQGEISYTEPATPISDFLMVLEVKEPTLRYIKFTLTPSVANAVICGIEVIRYSNVKPVTQVVDTKGVLKSACLITPATV